MIYGSEEYRKKADTDIRAWLAARIQMIDNIPDNYFKALCYFALIENFAQEYKNYPVNGTAKVFCDFILKFNSSYAFLDQYDPVTLYYDFEPQLKSFFDLSFLDYGINYNPDQAVLHGNVMEMVKRLKALEVKESRIDKHIFVRLLYSLRSKLSHELYNQHTMLATDLHLLKEYPYYVPCSLSFENEEGERVRDKIWDLVVPVGFIKNLALECISKYLDYCLENKNDPFENNSLNRKSIKTWYD